MGYQQSQINTNYYVVRKISEIIIVLHWICLKNLKNIYTIHPKQICTMQKYDANDNKMVCIRKVN